MSNLREKTVKGVAWSAIVKWGNQVISLIVFTLLTRLLESEDFGLVAMAAVFTAFMQLFLDQGMSQAIKYFNKFNEKKTMNLKYKIKKQIQFTPLHHIYKIYKNGRGNQRFPYENIYHCCTQ